MTEPGTEDWRKSVRASITFQTEVVKEIIATLDKNHLKFNEPQADALLISAMLIVFFMPDEVCTPC